MRTHKRIALASALLAAIGISPLVSAHDAMRHAPPLTEQQMQSLATEGAPYHAGDQSIYDESIERSMVVPPWRRIPARDGIILPDDATNDLTPAEASSITGHADSAAGPALSGSEAQAGNMGPKNSKGQ